jgi:hypothetical protein
MEVAKATSKLITDYPKPEKSIAIDTPKGKKNIG